MKKKLCYQCSYDVFYSFFDGRKMYYFFGAKQKKATIPFVYNPYFIIISYFCPKFTKK